MKSRLFLLSAMTLAIGLFGCSTSKVPQIEAKYYPQCYDPIAKLCKDQDNSNEVKSSVVGGIFGAVGGAVIGGLASKDKKKGALIGALAGAAVGASVGFFKARLEKIEDREQRLAEYQTILGEVSDQWDLEKASVETALKCYDEQISILEDLIKNKKISKEEFLERMNEIAQGLDNIQIYWADASTNIDSQMADGEKFLEEEEARIKAEEDAKKLQAQKARKQREALMRQKKNRELAMKKIKNGKEEVDTGIKNTKDHLVQVRRKKANDDGAGELGEEGMAMNNTSLNYYGLTANR